MDYVFNLKHLLADYERKVLIQDESATASSINNSSIFLNLILQERLKSENRLKNWSYQKLNSQLKKIINCLGSTLDFCQDKTEHANFLTSVANEVKLENRKSQGVSNVRAKTRI